VRAGHATILRMPLFEIAGRGPTNRARRRTYRALDEPTAREMAAKEGTVVERVTELPEPRASADEVARAQALGAKLSEAPSVGDVVGAVLDLLSARRRVAELSFGSDPDGRSICLRAEPYGFRQSREGVRLRCFTYPPDPMPEIFGANEAPGWHFYLIDEIEGVRDTGESFTPRPYRRDEGDLVIELKL